MVVARHEPQIKKTGVNTMAKLENTSSLTESGEKGTCLHQEA